MPKPKPPDAEKFTEIAAECARICGVDVRLTPLAEVLVQVGQPPGREVACIGVRFEDEYVIVRLPTGGFRAFKVDAAGRVVLRLGVRGGFRSHVSWVFGALIWDRLKRGRSQYEPQLELLPVEEVVPLVAEPVHLEEAEPRPRKPTSSQRRPNLAAALPPEPSPPEPPPAAEPQATSAPPAQEPPPPVAPPPPSSEPQGSSCDPGTPLGRRLRGSRAK